MLGEIHVIIGLIGLIVELLREILQRVTHIESLTHIVDSHSRASNRYESLERYRVAYTSAEGFPDNQTNPDAEDEID